MVCDYYISETVSFKGPAPLPTYPDDYVLPAPSVGTERPWSHFSPTYTEMTFFAEREYNLTLYDTTKSTFYVYNATGDRELPSFYSLAFLPTGLSYIADDNQLYHICLAVGARLSGTDTLTMDFNALVKERGLAYYLVPYDVDFKEHSDISIATRLPFEYTPVIPDYFNNGILWFLYTLGEQILQSANGLYAFMSYKILGTPFVALLFGAGFIFIVAYSVVKWLIPL